MKSTTMIKKTKAVWALLMLVIMALNFALVSSKKKGRDPRQTRKTLLMKMEMTPRRAPMTRALMIRRELMVRIKMKMTTRILTTRVLMVRIKLEKMEITLEMARRVIKMNLTPWEIDQ